MLRFAKRPDHVGTLSDCCDQSESLQLIFLPDGPFLSHLPLMKLIGIAERSLRRSNVPWIHRGYIHF
jgi:hypothetical protein